MENQIVIESPRAVLHPVYVTMQDEPTLKNIFWTVEDKCTDMDIEPPSYSKETRMAIDGTLAPVSRLKVVADTNLAYYVFFEALGRMSSLGKDLYAAGIDKVRESMYELGMLEIAQRASKVDEGELPLDGLSVAEKSVLDLISNGGKRDTQISMQNGRLTISIDL